MAKKKLKLDISKLTKELDIVTKQLTAISMIGAYQSVFRGVGLEFDSFRKYTQGDDAKFIDWKASMKANELLIKQFVEERSLNVFFLLDISNSMLFGSTQKLKNQYAAELVASLAFAVMRADDNIGLAMFNDEIVRSSYPTTGEKQYYNILRNLVDLSFYGGGYDFAKSLKFVISILPQNTLLIIASDFIGLHGEWEKYLKIVCSKFDVITLMIRDPRDRELIGDIGDVVISSPYSNEKITINPDIIKERYKEYIKQQEKEIRNIFEKAGSDFELLTTDKPFIKPIINLFKRRALKFR